MAQSGDPRPWPAPWGRWFVACTVAEVLGIAAAAGAAGLGLAVVGEPTSAGDALAILALAVIGGSLEGLAIGALQVRVLRTWLPAVSTFRYVGGTVVMAALFWLLGMLPSTLMSLDGEATSTTAIDPPLLAVALASALGGACAGVVFGAVQGWALRGYVDHPWRWIRPNAVGWGIAVAVITIGASLVPAGWSVGLLIVFGGMLGVVSGASVGLVTAQALPSLELNLAWWNRTVVDLLLSPWHRLESGSVVVLRFAGRRSGATITLPVQYARDADGLVVFVARAESKTWWRSFEGESRRVLLVCKGARLTGMATTLSAGDSAHAAALSTYSRRWARVSVPSDAVLVRIVLDA